MDTLCHGLVQCAKAGDLLALSAEAVVLVCVVAVLRFCELDAHGFGHP